MPSAMPLCHPFPLLILLCCIGLRTMAQTDHLFRVYEDNDFINVAGKGTDKGYTNGTRFDYFYNRKTPARLFVDKWFPTAGAGSVNTFSYSIMQVMLVPNDLSRTLPDKHDWPYSGSLVIAHSLYSAQPAEKWALQAELTAGVIGPIALARETQTLVHSLIRYTKPKGWAVQMPTDVLLNLSVQGEKLFWQPGKALELMGGAQVQVGTMLDGASLHVLIRAGHMEPYFNGYLQQFASARNTGHRRLQYYFFLRPAVQWWNFNALLEGGLFRGKSGYYAGTDSRGESPSLRRIAATVDVGLVLVLGNFGLSFTQREMSPLIHSVSDQTIGNISLTLAW